MNITFKIHTGLHSGLEWRIFCGLSSECLNTISLFPPLTVYVNSQFVYVIKRKKKKMVAWRYEFYLLVLKTILYSDAVLFLKILFLPLKNKISIFAISSVFKFLVIFGDQSIYSSFPRPLQVLCVYHCSENNAKVCF